MSDYDKIQTTEELNAALVNRILDDMIEEKGMWETLDYLFSLGVTRSQITDDLGFYEKDVKEYEDSFEEDDDDF